MKVKEIMHRDATWIGPDAPLSNVAAKLSESDVGAVPISEYDRLVGVITKRDLARCTTNAERLKARDAMSKPIIYCYPDEDVEDALHIMERHAVRALPVVSHQKRVIGHISFSDVARGAR